MIKFGRETTGEFNQVENKEWLITNGIGGYASGTIAGSLSRGYHGLLVSAIKPPIDRRLYLAKLEETVKYMENSYPLSSNHWENNIIEPKGYLNIESFELQDSTPCWRFAFSDALIEKKVWMQQGENTTYVTYTVLRANDPICLSLSAIANNRVFHYTSEVNKPSKIQEIPNGIKCYFDESSSNPLSLVLKEAEINIKNEIFSNFYLNKEAERGLNALDHHVHVANFEITLKEGETACFTASTESSPSEFTNTKKQAIERSNQILSKWPHSNLLTNPDIRQLVLASDQFIVNRSTDGKSIIAGYHWFEDWGRDTMISLPGLALSIDRREDAKLILETFAKYVDQGMLPNRFPDLTETPEYNTIDATLWYFQAIRDYYKLTHDKNFIKELFPKLQEIISTHINGTRYNIHMDKNDGLLYGGEDGVQLTWMDAKVGNNVITPRIGKTVEVNALWYNALTTMSWLSKEINSLDIYSELANLCKSNFNKFWNDDKGYCYDVIEGPNGHEDLLRPNQIFCVSLPDQPFEDRYNIKIVNSCSEHLLTSHGLRSLAPFEIEYKNHYKGNSYQRDSAYHQGTVWSWLLGPFAIAHMKVFKNKSRASELLTPIMTHMTGAGIGTISEIFDASPPFKPKGCIAQAWSVGQILYALDFIESYKQ
ncbi:amylo-alpha-1,6-glucosidase [Aureibacter tunicatorum]|uniref:Glycogen debranching enzyme n=1 Tax=Aureibacter tunicatorum TaxID=866807 RepID=A0AAE3XP71_9BACT|nr:amylo-alpha-1,6-glucosidase [Aureibacter tunicatorum]MDR6239386.1 putative glycogen debranching enzyme [Aureibacter tunicatorum]BDD04691.1 glycogen debranching protein [Aureibacter tunicatorum]